MPKHLDQYTLPPITPIKGGGLSLLISDEFYVDESLHDQIAKELKVLDLHILVARPPRRPQGISRFFAPRRTVDWFSCQTGIDRSSSQSIISSLPVDVHPTLDWNAGNPKNLLGVAAAIHQKPDILIFSSLGMDPAGVSALYRFITSRQNDFFAIYVSWSCRRSGSDCDFRSLPYSDRVWLQTERENKSDHVR